MAHPENPFPAIAVTTFGVPTKVADLKYMRDARALMVAYLQGYQGTGTGTTIALRGAHGSGKTFLLSWLAGQAAALTSAPCRVIYAKVDSPSIVDLYQQLMLQITRDDLVKTTREALRLRAEKIAAGAKATSSTAKEIRQTGDLEAAYQSKVIDPNALNLELRGALEEASLSPDVGRRVAAAVGLLDNSDWGEEAFAWLAGRPANLPNEALRASLFEADSTNPDEAVVSALEVLAILFRFAGTPLVILVDQLENLVPTRDVAQTSSILKKLMEQLSGQRVMFMLAGTPSAWKRLPRDVRPRIAQRLDVGNLSATEAKDLLKAYLKEIPISAGCASTIFRIAGGNPREILQTAFQVYEETGGRFTRVREDRIRIAARKAGTLADREQAALEILEQTAEEEGIQVGPSGWEEAAELDRVARSPTGGSLVIVFAVSSDRQAEAELALRLTRLTRRLATEPGRPAMLVVAIGYSSDQVRDLLSGISRVLFFNEGRFGRELKKEFAKLVSAPDVAAPQTPQPVDRELLHRLDKLEHLLSDLQRTRVRSDEETAQRFSALTEASAAPERRQTEIRTRSELREGLAELNTALGRQNLGEERAIMRRLQVANEANIGNASFDLLGTLYLDALDAAYLAGRRGEGAGLLDQLEEFRADLLRLLREATSPGATRLTDRLEFRAITAAGFGLLGAFFTYLSLPILLGRLVRYEEYRVTSLILTALGFLLFLGLGYALGEYLRRPERRFHGMARYLDRLRLRHGLDRPT